MQAAPADGTGYAGVRGRARSYRYGVFLQLVGPLCAGMPAKQATRWMAPAAPVFAGKPAPTGTAYSFSWWGPCGSGFTREAGDAVEGTGYAGVRGRAELA